MHTIALDYLAYREEEFSRTQTPPPNKRRKGKEGRCKTLANEKVLKNKNKNKR